MNRLFGLIGYPLEHSFSPDYFAEKFEREAIHDAEYRSFPLEDISTLPQLIYDHYPQLVGLNVTIPYKEEVIPHLDALGPEAEAIGAVNTILIRNKTATGFNTDYIGFTRSLIPLLKDRKVKALILGTGGASKAVAYALKRLNIPFQYVSRSSREGVFSYGQLTGDIIKEHRLIINTTPLGMHPDTESLPDLPYDALTADHLCYDLVYNPEETLFQQKAKAQGAAIKNGLEMLHLQAEAAWRIWTGF